jgi:hypothetical protein
MPDDDEDEEEERKNTWAVNECVEGRRRGREGVTFSRCHPASGTGGLSDGM